MTTSMPLSLSSCISLKTMASVVGSVWRPGWFTLKPQRSFLSNLVSGCTMMVGRGRSSKVVSSTIRGPKRVTWNSSTVLMVIGIYLQDRKVRTTLYKLNKDKHHIHILGTQNHTSL